MSFNTGADACPDCGNEVGNRVQETRTRPTDGAIKRRRKCGQCESRWTTYETKIVERRVLPASPRILEMMLHEVGQ
jgi:transcriptional regulator NrdR family protein